HRLPVTGGYDVHPLIPSSRSDTSIPAGPPQKVGTVVLVLGGGHRAHVTCCRARRLLAGCPVDYLARVLEHIAGQPATVGRWDDNVLQEVPDLAAPRLVEDVAVVVNARQLSALAAQGGSVLLHCR